MQFTESNALGNQHVALDSPPPPEAGGSLRLEAAQDCLGVAVKDVVPVVVGDVFAQQ